MPDRDRFSTKDARVLFRLGEFVGNMLRTSSKLDQAQALYNASLTTSQRSNALLDVTKMLASETTLDRYAYIYHTIYSIHCMMLMMVLRHIVLYPSYVSKCPNYWTQTGVPCSLWTKRNNS